MTLTKNTRKTRAFKLELNLRVSPFDAGLTAVLIYAKRELKVIQ